MCHHRRHLERGPAQRVAPARVDAPTPPSGPIRVGDADRERVVELLRTHAGAGRLQPDELEERIERAYAARYGSDLQAVLADLPDERPAAQAREPRGVATTAPLLPIAIAALIALAAITGAWWLLWLIWPIVVVLGPKRHYRRARI